MSLTVKIFVYTPTEQQLWVLFDNIEMEASFGADFANMCARIDQIFGSIMTNFLCKSDFYKRHKNHCNR